MTLLVPGLLSHSRQQASLVVFQSSAAQTTLPVLNTLIGKAQSQVILVHLLYPPSIFHRADNARVQILDFTDDVPGYSDGDRNLKDELLAAISSVGVAEPVTVVVDSVDTLSLNIGSKAAAYGLLGAVYRAVQEHPSSQLVVHDTSPSQLIPLLSQTSFSPSLTHITAHPPCLLTHLATALSTPPPPLSPPEKFWSVFLPVASRTYESEELVLGPSAEGSGGNDIVLEILVRGSDNRKRAVERVLEGWDIAKERACELRELESLRALWTAKSTPAEAAVDPSQGTTFNLNLTPEQQQARTQVPLPYAHTGSGTKPTQQAAILYDPDSADDIDDDDPDEDLDI